MFSKKNVIVANPSNTFTELYVDMLINKCGISNKDIIFITLTPDNNDLLSKYDVSSYYHKDCELNEINNCKTITFISLHKSNGFFIKKLFDYSNTFIDKTYIHLTDDEVARWFKTKVKYGYLRLTRSNNVDDNVINVLNKVNNFIAPEAYFRDKIEYITGRTGLKFIDGRDAFKSLPSTLWGHLELLYSVPSKYTNPEKSIFIGAKRGAFSFIQVISLIHSLKKEKILPSFKCLIFTCPKRKLFRIILDLYFNYLRYFKKCNVDISYPTATNAVTYNALIMSCSHLIIQDRGSMSTARSYLSLGRGTVHVRKSSPNYFELTDSECLDVASYTSFQYLAKNINNEIVNVKDNQKQMLARFEQKYENLKEIYK